LPVLSSLAAVGASFARWTTLTKGDPFARKGLATRVAVAKPATAVGAAWLAFPGSLKAATLILNFCTTRPLTGLDPDAVDLLPGPPLRGRQGLSSVDLLNLFRACNA
jgi:hypothetical protein